MNPPVWTKSATSYANREFIHVIANCGYRISFADYGAEEFFLAPDAAEADIGSAVENSLAQSRMLSIPEVRLRQGEATELYNDWVRRTMERFSYKTKRAMFKDMKSCGIYLLDKHIRFNPSQHYRLEAWRDLDQSQNILVSINSSSAELGAALRLALSRCT